MRILLLCAALLLAPLQALAGQVVFSADMAELGVATSGCSPQVVTTGPWRHKVMRCTPGSNAIFYIPSSDAFPSTAPNSWTGTLHAQRPSGTTGTNCQFRFGWYAVPNNTAMSFTMSALSAVKTVTLTEAEKRYLLVDPDPALDVQNGSSGACTGTPSVCAGAQVIAIIEVLATSGAEVCDFRKLVGNF